jgi:flagellar hook assembly protein FlgD
VVIPLRRALLLGAAAGLVVAASAAPAHAATPLQVTGASVLSSTSVLVSFDRAVGVSAETLANYAISPSLTVTKATRVDGDFAVVLTTAKQFNGTAYTLTVSNVVGAAGETLPAPATTGFSGTLLGLNSTSSFQDDFNRASSLVTTDAPIPGPWTATIVDRGNSLAIVGSPALEGSGALRSTVTSLSAEKDNASVNYAITSDELFLSAYVYLPQQTWGATQAVGLLRADQTLASAHARVTAYYDTPSTYQVRVNWKATGNAYYGDQVVATGIPFDTWHWVQLHVLNSTASSKPGKIQVWIDGVLRYEQHTIYVQNTGMNFVEYGIMHNITTGPSSTTITDGVRFGTSYQLPLKVTDTTAPAVTLASPTDSSALSGTATLSVAASDDVGIQRVQYLIDGSVKASSDVPPFSATYGTLSLANGQHTFAARAYDTSGNVATSPTVTATVSNVAPEVLNPTVAPQPFSPNKDGVADKATATFTTSETASQRVTIWNGATLVKTLRSWASYAAGAQSVSWDGTRYDSATKTNQPLPDGNYTARIEARGANGLVTTVDLPVTIIRALSSLARSAASFSPNGDGRLETTAVSYKLLDAATVSVQVETTGGTAVRVLQDPVAQAAGSFSVVWDGTDGAMVRVADGTYVIRAIATTAVGSISMTKTVVVDTAPPTIVLGSISPDPYDGVGSLTVPITVSEAGTATTKFYRDGSSSSSRSLSTSIAAGGTVNVTWNGLNGDGTAAASGSYTVRVYFQDKAGNHATTYPATGNFTLAR